MKPKLQTILPTVVLVGAALCLVGFGLTRRCNPGEHKAFFTCRSKTIELPGGEPTDGYQVAIPSDLIARFSRGEKILFTADGSPDLEDGVDAMSKRKYNLAIKSFELAVSNRKNDPESQIYLQNAMAQEKGNPYTLAVVVPVNKSAKSAQEMLRGVADAQALFNESSGNRLLEIVIANDENNANIASSISAVIVEMPDILGVIGHNSSGASLAAKPAYEAAGIAMISPTSTSTGLSGKTFFRTAPSDAMAGEALAEYVTETLSIDNVIAFFDSNSSYSISLLEAFKEEFEGRVGRTVDLASPPNLSQVIENLPQETGTILLFPSSGTKDRALSVARAAQASSSASDLPLIGGDTLYDSDTLKEGGAEVEGLILAVPWFANTPYAAKAEDRWGGRVSWRTATSFDATQALTSTLSAESDRQEVLASLADVQLSAAKTAGSVLQFDSEGERIEKPVLVKVVEGGISPEGTNFGFELVR